MTEWWTYRPSDFLMFSSRVYYRQIESFNADHWPLHLVLFALGVYLVFACWSQRRSHIRLSFFLLSGMWAFVSLDYLRAYLLTIHWGAVYAVWAFLLQAVLLSFRGVCSSEKSLPPQTPARWIGSALVTGALVVYPCLALLYGRGLKAVEVMGMMPTPTAIATVGFLLAARPKRIDLALIAIPALWCLLDAITVHTMRQPGWWVAPAMLFLALPVAFFNRGQSSTA